MAEGPDFSLVAASAQTGLDVQNKLRMDSLARTVNAGNTEEKKLVEACRGFESAFLQKLMTQMRATVPKDGLLHGPYEDKYLSMFDQAMGDKLAEAGGIGLADMMLAQLRDRVAGKKSGGAAASDQPGRISPAGAVAHSLASPGTTLPATRTAAQAPTGQGLGLSRVPTTTGTTARAPQRISHDPVLAHPSHALFLSQETAPAATAETEAGRVARDQAERELAAPVTGSITSEFGWRGDPFTGKTAWHAGMDIAASQGDPVSACWDGQVVFAGPRGGYGNAVVVQHEGGWRSIYGHLSQIDVKEGDVVGAGRKIAEVGSTGRSTGPHLHFELRYAGASVDPLQVGIYAARPLVQAANVDTARDTRQSGGGSHDFADHRQPGQAGEGLDPSGHASGGRIYPFEGA